MLRGEKWNFFLRNSFFGSVINPDTTLSQTINDTAVSIHPEFGAKILTDMSFGYDVSENMTLTIGSSIFLMFTQINLLQLQQVI